MRFSVHKSMLEMCNTLKEAINYMYQNETTDLIDGCLDILVSINSTLLENDVTEFDFNIINNLSAEFNSQNIDLQKAYDLIFDLENEIKTNVKYKLKVLFVAEDSSKWDAMASVYENIVKRDDCEVQATIEPHFIANKMPDGTTKSEVILEDHLSPLGIPNVHWSQYDFETELPDITFYSQPYEYNTSEKFWPQNMAKYTKVVYLPYYVARTINRNISTATFCCFFKCDTENLAWKIVAQSEMMKKHYKNFGSRKGENVIVTGLPKYDYPMKLTKENVKCPDDWAKKLEGRKVFLLNTHFYEFEKVDESFQKLKELIEVFLENKEAALIWRPHPLTETVIRVRKSEFWIEYKEFKDKIKATENIIYDDEPNYEMSFAYSDALISTNSSIVVIFLLMNKPILLAYNTETSFKWRENLNTNDGLFDLNKLPVAVELAEKKKFIDDIVNGNDEWQEQREELIKDYLTLADGRCGERVVEAIINEFNKENEDVEIEINEAKNLFIIGNKEESKFAIKSFEARNVEFSVCSEFYGETDDYKTVSLFEAENENYDLFLITAKNSEVIKDMLLERNIKLEKILEFWKMYNAGIPSSVCDKAMLNPKIKSFEGIILGTGHAANGIITSQFKNKNFCNLAVSSQDIYYNYKTLEHCLKTYPEKLKNLKYAIIDMYDYNYFNYDASQSNSIVDYVFSGGITFDEHNFSKNKNYNKLSFEDFVRTIESEKFEGITDIDLANWLVNFPDIYTVSEFYGFGYDDTEFKNRTKVITDEDVDNYKFDRKVVVNLFDKTIEENIKYFEKTIELLLNINPKIKLYLISIPKFVEVETHNANELYKHEKAFCEIIEEISSKFKFEFIDFKASSDIMYNRNYFFDANHLNYYGEMQLTKELNDRMF